MEFEWDPKKARLNVSKHGIHFPDALPVLEDERALTIAEGIGGGRTAVDHAWHRRARESAGCGLHLAKWPRAGDLRPAGDTRRAASVRRGLVKEDYDFTQAKRGPVVKVPAGKTRVTIRLDNDILDWFRTHVDESGGGNYQTLINEALREYLAPQREPLESTLRRVLREELRRVG